MLRHKDAKCSSSTYGMHGALCMRSNTYKFHCQTCTISSISHQNAASLQHTACLHTPTHAVATLSRKTEDAHAIACIAKGQPLHRKAHSLGTSATSAYYAQLKRYLASVLQSCAGDTDRLMHGQAAAQRGYPHKQNQQTAVRDAQSQPVTTITALNGPCSKPASV